MFLSSGLSLILIRYVPFPPFNIASYFDSKKMLPIVQAQAVASEDFDCLPLEAPLFLRVFNLDKTKLVKEYNAATVGIVVLFSTYLDVKIFVSDVTVLLNCRFQRNYNSHRMNSLTFALFVAAITVTKLKVTCLSIFYFI